MEQLYNKHYIRIDVNNRVIQGFSDAFEQPKSIDICINQEGGRHFELSGQINPPLMDLHGCHLYKYLNGEVKETTPEERTSEVEPLQLEESKKLKISESKDKLEEYLTNNPYLFLDGKYYSVMKEKQNLLTSAIAIYQIKIQSGEVNPHLTWNSVGETCVDWTIDNLSALAIGISAYVYPLVSKQQELEVSIRNCKTIAELDKVVIDYETVA